MILYFMDRTGVVIGSASTELKGGYQIIDDNKTESIENLSTVMDATLSFDDETRLEVERLTKPGNYVLRYEPEEHEKNNAIGQSVEGLSDFFTIIDHEVNKLDATINIYCESGGLDLLNDLAYPYSASTSQTVGHYISKALEGTSFRLRDVVDVSESKILGWEEAETVVARLRSICASFDCELSYGFTVKGLTLIDRWVDIRKKLGVDTGEILTVNHELNNIIVKRSISNLATALYATAGDGDNVITLEGYTIPDPDGDFFIDGAYLKSTKGLYSWSRFGGGSNGGYIYRDYNSTKATDQESLYLEAKKKLTELREGEVNYEVDIAELPKNVKIGDRVNIVDRDGDIYVSGRILTLSTSISGRSKTATIGDYLIKSSGLSEKVRQLAADFKEISESKTLYLWIAYATSSTPSLSDISIDPAGKTYIGTLPNQGDELTNISQITSDKLSKFKWSKTEGTGSDGIVLRVIPNNTIFKNKAGTVEMNVKIYVGETVISDIDELHAYWPNAGIRWYRRLGSSEVEISTDSSFEHFRNNKFILNVSYNAIITSMISYRAVLDNDISN